MTNDRGNALSAAPAPASGVDVAAVREAWSFLQDRLLEFEQEIGGGEEEREWAGHVMPALSRFGSLIASLSPAATSGSEAGGDPGDVWVLFSDGHPLFLSGSKQAVEGAQKAYAEGGKRTDGPFRYALAKPSSPAGGDVREALERLKERESDTNWHPMYRDGLMAAIREIDAAMSSTSAAEPVADVDSAYQAGIEDAMRNGLTAPAAVEMREEAAQAALARIRKLRDGYADQAKFADVDEARLFRQFVERLDRAESAERQRDEALAALKAAREALADPVAVHINMMRGTIAKPSLENIHHLYPEIRENAARMRHALRECQSALAMMTAPDAVKQTTVINAYAAAVAAEAKARKVLENGPAGLADATNNPPSDPGTEQREAGV